MAFAVQVQEAVADWLKYVDGPDLDVACGPYTFSRTYSLQLIIFLSQSFVARTLRPHRRT